MTNGRRVASSQGPRPTRNQLTQNKREMCSLFTRQVNGSTGRRKWGLCSWTNSPIVRRDVRLPNKLRLGDMKGAAGIANCRAGHLHDKQHREPTKGSRAVPVSEKFPLTCMKHGVRGVPHIGRGSIRGCHMFGGAQYVPATPWPQLLGPSITAGTPARCMRAPCASGARSRCCCPSPACQAKPHTRGH